MVLKGTGRLRILDPRWTALAGLTLGSVEDAQIFKSAEVATLLGVTPRMVRYLSGQGKLHFVVVGKRRFYSLSAIREALRERNNGMEGRKKLGTRPWLMEWAKQRL